MKLYIYVALTSLSCAAAVLFASAAPTASHLPTTDGLPLTQAVSHVRSVSSTRLAPTKEQEGRRQLEACQFADGKPGTKCVGANACAQIDLSKIGCGSCNGANACLFPVITDKVSVGENSCNGFEACNWHFIIGCSMELQAMLELVKEVGELNCISTFNTAL